MPTKEELQKDLRAIWAETHEIHRQMAHICRMVNDLELEIRKLPDEKEEK